MHSGPKSQTKKHARRNGSGGEPLEDGYYDGEDDEDQTNLPSFKHPAPKLTNFSGNIKDWMSWKRAALAKLGGFQYGQLLTSRAYADRNKQRNSMLFAILEDKTSDGLASHIIHRFEKTTDGHAAWTYLNKRYDGDETMKSNQATHLKGSLRMHENVLP